MYRIQSGGFHSGTSSNPLTIRQEVTPVYHKAYIHVKLPIVRLEVQDLGETRESKPHEQLEAPRH
jgi:hypothetical protein